MERDACCIPAATDGLAQSLSGRIQSQGAKYEEDVAAKDVTASTTTGTDCASTEASDSDERSEVPPITTRMVYLVRHGEAVHNVLENEAKKRAGVEAEALGHTKGSEPYKAMVEMARKAVLHDAKQVDPPLSKNGFVQADATNAQMKWLNSGPMHLPEPTGVFVSPLQRTLQTAASVFPSHPNVRVHELVRERRTGLACDEPSPQRAMCRRRTFSHMDFGNVLKGDCPAQDVNDDALPVHEKFPDDPRRCCSETAIGKLEDAPALRLRTAMLGELLRSVEDQAVCVVTHKGYLRELERGPLGQPEATEFGTGEIRVYEVVVGTDGGMSATIRYRKDLHGEGGAVEDAGAPKA